MIGSVSAQRGVLHGSITSKLSVSGAVINRGVSMAGSVCIPSIAALDVYEGSYEVLPSVEVQTMDTAGKRMAGDVRVLAIPLYEVSNDCGLTLIIGG